MPRRWNVDSGSSENRLATIKARLDSLAAVVRAQAGVFARELAQRQVREAAAGEEVQQNCGTPQHGE